MSQLLKELFGGKGDRTRRAYSVQKWQGFSPNLYRKVEWAKEVIRIWRENVKYNLRTPYPHMPPERHMSKGAQQARSRGGKARAAAIRRRKHGRKVKAEARQSGAKASVTTNGETG